MAWADEVALRCHERLMGPDGANARAYLASRGVTREELGLYQCGMAAPLGLVPKEFDRWAQSYWEGRLVFPLTSTLGTAIGFQTRPLGSKAYQLFYTTPATVHPYGFGVHQALPEVWRTGQVVLVEGVFDLFAARKVAPNTVACLTATVGGPILEFVRRFAVRAFALLDMDAPGRRGVALMQRALSGLPVVAPAYSEHDPSDLLSAGKTRELVALLRAARDVLDARPLAHQ